MTPRDIGPTIVELAINASTAADAIEVQSMIESAIGARHERPLKDTVNNYGIVTGSGGSYDHKSIENVTNMQDAIIERFAVEKYGLEGDVDFRDPHQAAEILLSDLDANQRAQLAQVHFYDSGEDPKAKMITMVFRDRGCGMTPRLVTQTIYGLGNNNKTEKPWLQGAFGLGGAMTYRNALHVVLVTRRAPKLLTKGEEDRITVAILSWQQHAKIMGAYYLVTSEWDKTSGSLAEPYSVRSTAYPKFEAGTHLALVSYAVEGFHRKRSDDEKAFPTVLNTRLFRPTVPVSFVNHITRDKRELLRGLDRRFADNPRPDRLEGSTEIPFRSNGDSYHLPVKYYVFAPPSSTAGKRRGFVAHGHALVMTSNGQVHEHWTPQEFKSKTRKVNRLHDRVLVVLETDSLPIEVRTRMFTADRQRGVSTEEKNRLDAALIAALEEWPELQEINNQIIRDAIAGASGTQNTMGIAQKIGRALTVRGFSLPGSGRSAGGGRSTGLRARPPQLYKDPTTLEGPTRVVVQRGDTLSVSYHVNAVDEFIPRSGNLEVRCSHPGIDSSDITVGHLRSGKVRVMVAVPEEVDVGDYEIDVVLDGWTRSSGGIGSRFAWNTALEVVDEITRAPRAGKGRNGKGGDRAGEGNLVAVKWTNPKEQAREGWDKAMVGEVMQVPAEVLASEHEEYQELAKLGSRPIPTILLNTEYTPLKKYTQGRLAESSKDAAEQARGRYAVGVGVSLLLIDRDTEKKEKKGEAVPAGVVSAAKDAAARGVLSVLPDYDRLLGELD